MIPESPIWREVILSLHRKGWTDSQIAEKVGVSRGTINNIKNERFAGVMFQTGAALLNLHDKETKHADS